ncbi:MAG: DUF2169 domain-containing protein [Minicystis sp.]
MELVNRTPLVADLRLARAPGPRTESEHTLKLGMIVAKATFRFGATEAEIETQAPVPLFSDDQETELGLLPRDDLPRGDPAFEVVVLGAAHAPMGREIAQRTVALTVGSERRELLVTGDRAWELREGTRRISAPARFSRMPLTYARAFGGTIEVLIDREAPIDIADPLNPQGKGFDPGPAIEAQAQLFQVPPGYPQYDALRRLPNVEDVKAPISRWDDAPRPVGWAAVPMSIGLHALRIVGRDPRDAARPDPEAFAPDVFHRAHPDWVIALPKRGSTVTLEGLTPEPRVSFALPALRVHADYLVDARVGTLDLAPQMLVLLPEERRFYLVYRALFSMEVHPDQARVMRLRVSPGWPEERTS